MVAGVADDVAEAVEDAMDVLEAAAPVPLADKSDVDVAFEVPSVAVDDAMAESVVVATTVFVSTCR